MRPLLLALLAGLLAACSGTVTGTPTPTSLPTATATPSAAPLVPLPPRPRTVDVTGIDPCTVLTVDQRKQLGLDGKPSGEDYHSALYKGGIVRLCSTVGTRPRSVAAAVQLATSAGIEVYTANPINGVATPTTVHGFPAVRAAQTDHPEFCSVVVDVAPGQAVDVQFRDVGRDPPIPQADLCTAAEHTADLAMATLTTTLGR